jgi:hypothetical protein
VQFFEGQPFIALTYRVSNSNVSRGVGCLSWGILSYVPITLVGILSSQASSSSHPKESVLLFLSMRDLTDSSHFCVFFLVKSKMHRPEANIGMCLANTDNCETTTESE